VKKIKAFLESFDRYQQQTPWLGFPIGVAKKFGDDQAGYLASLVAYYGFFSLFPLLLVFSTILGFVLGRNSHLKGQILHSVLARLPIIGQQLSVGSLRGSGLGLAVGIVFTLLAGIGVIQALQYGMNEVWGVPFTKRPNFLMSRLRALIMLAVFGVASLLTTFLSGLGASGGSLSIALKILGPLASVALDFGILAIAFRVLTTADVSWRDVAPGALTGALALAILQVVGGYYVTHQLKNASQTYGTFAVVIGLLSWLYLGAQIAYYAAEINVVKSKHLWPRSIITPPTDAEERAVASQAKKQQRRPDESVRVGFGAPPSRRGSQRR